MYTGRLMKNSLTAFFFFLAITLGWSVLSLSHAGVEEDIAALKKEVAEIKEELGKIKDLLSQDEPPQISEIDLGTSPILGKKDAPVTLIEFSDHHCPFCARFQQETFPRIKKEYIDTGKARYVFRNFPLLGMHPQAVTAAEAARCAGDQDRYWEMHEFLFKNPKKATGAELQEQAGKLGLDVARFRACLDQKKYAGAVKKDLEAGTTAGVRGTPSFFIGKTTPSEKIRGRLLVGAQPFEAFREAMDALLAEAPGK